MPRLALVCIALVASSAHAQAPDPAVRSLVAAFADSLGLPSLVVAVTRDGVRTVYTEGDVGGSPPDVQTRYEVGSLTKPVTALALAEAVRRGEVGLDTPVACLLADSVAAGPAMRRVRLVDLATHTSGLPRLPANLRPTSVLDPYADYTPASLMAFVEAAAPATAPGEVYAYSNVGAGLLAYALARRAGTDVETLLRTRVLEPLGMDGASFGGAVAGPHTSAGAAIAPWTWTDALAGAGTLRASASDLLALAEAVIDPDGTPLAEALRETTRSRTLAPGRFRVGLVWHLLPVEAGTAPETVVHNGATFGSTAFLGVVPEAGVGVAVLTNGAASVEAFALHLLGRLAAGR